MEKLILNISGMTCDHCVRQIDDGLRSTAGVHDATVDLASGTATVIHDAEGCGPADLVAAVERAGFSVNGFRPGDDSV